MIVWKESYSTGVEQLDKQHRDLFDYTNHLGENISDGAVSTRLMNETLTFLKQYIKVHFGREEECMYRASCPVAGKNKDAHEQFIKRFSEMEEKIRTDNSVESVQELHRFLETWLVDHICKIDTNLKLCVVGMK